MGEHSRSWAACRGQVAALKACSESQRKGGGGGVAGGGVAAGVATAGGSAAAAAGGNAAAAAGGGAVGAAGGAAASRFRLRALSLALFGAACVGTPIDRRAVVSRHDIAMVAADSSALNTTYDTFQVGNGAFSFNCDVTGAQSFNASYAHFGVNILADWMWHSAPFSPSDPTLALRAYNFSFYETPTDGKGGTRRVPYANNQGNAADVTQWLNDNPHRLNLGQLSLRLWDDAANASSPLQLGSIVNASQRLSLWEGLLDSNFTVGADPGGGTCSLTQDNNVASFSCGGGVIAGGWASYGRPTGSCAAGFAPAPDCASPNATAALARLCTGKPACSFLVNYLAGFGDPCPGRAKWLAASVTCSAPPPPAAQPLAVRVRTVSDPDIDMVALRVECGAGSRPCPLALRLAFPYGATSGSDWSRDGAHATTVVEAAAGSATMLRVLDGDSYTVRCSFDGGLTFRRAPGLAHAFDLMPGPGGIAAASVSCLFAPLRASGELRFPVGGGTQWLAAKAALTAAALAAPRLPLFPLVSAAAAASWAAFWGGGAFLDLASQQGPGKPAWELERRVVLSRYVMRVNNAGAEPPQETGLLCNSWGGKHHNEMRFWHLSHWALWGNVDLLARSDAFYFEQLQNATSFAAFEGYPGAHWPKETGAVANRSAGGIDVPWLGLQHAPWPFGGAPNGTLLVWESPQVDNALVIWQQPHLILMAELQRRAAAAAGGAPAAAAAVARLLPLVTASADYLAARFYFNESDGSAGRFWLGPPVVGGQEMGDPTRTFNPTFEMVYAGQALDIAAAWRVEGGLPPNPRYGEVAGGLAALPVDPASPAGGPPLYAFDEKCVCMYLKGGAANASCRAEWVPPGGSNCAALAAHPLVVAPFGLLSGSPRYGVDAESANATLRAVWAAWEGWEGAWGWDDGLLALSMARLGWRPEAIWEGPLLDPKFPYYRNGHTLCCPAYLPGNGALLLAVGVLAGGSDGSAAGLFPEAWGVVAEGFVVKYP